MNNNYPYIIETENLFFKYPDGTLALQDINIAIPAGSCQAFLGGNGAGKSTLFFNLNGLFRPCEGRILWQGQPLAYDKASLSRLRSLVGIILQDPNDQLFSANVYQDISFGALNLGLDEKEVRRRVDAAMEDCGISHLAGKATHALSFGQKKRVAIAGTLVMEPQLLILDEPTAGLDPMGVQELMKLLNDIRSHRGATIAISTHDIDLVPLYCDNVYLLHEGKIISQGSPDEIFANPELLRSKNLRLP
ncbi:MAG: ATP-binding cassette domain-containing protein, partial [Clostridiales bacterium]